MGLVPITGLLKEAKEKGYALGGFNVVNLETLQAVVEASEAENTPALIQVYHGDLEHAGLAYIVAMAQGAAASSKIPVALQLDHGQSYEQAVACIEAGFSAVMIDLSSSDFDENVRSTKAVVDIAHSRGVSVEAELGKIADASAPVEERNSGMTDPESAVTFVRETGVDALAVSVGTAHGMYSSNPVIDYPRLERLVKEVPAPIVVHGGSNTPDEDIRRIVKLGVAKVNIGTDLMNGFISGIQDELNSTSDLTVRGIMGHARDNTRAIVRQKIRLLNSYR